MANETEHLDLFDQVIHTLMNVGESIDFSAGQVRGGCHQIFIFGPESKFIGESSRIDVRPKTGMLGDVLHPLPVIIDNMMKIFKALDVILFGNNSFHFILLFAHSVIPVKTGIQTPGFLLELIPMKIGAGMTKKKRAKSF